MRVWLQRSAQTALMVFGFMIISVFAAGSVLAATRTWDGASDASCDEAGEYAFDTAACWEEDAVPADGDDLVFDVDPAVDLTVTQDIAGLSVKSLTVTNTTPGSLAELGIVGTEALAFDGDTVAATISVDDEANLAFAIDVTLDSDTEVLLNGPEAIITFFTGGSLDILANTLQISFYETGYDLLDKDSEPDTDMPAVYLMSDLSGAAGSMIEAKGVTFYWQNAATDASGFAGTMAMITTKMWMDETSLIPANIVKFQLSDSQLYVDTSTDVDIAERIDFSGNLFGDSTARDTGSTNAAILTAESENDLTLSGIVNLGSDIAYQMTSATTTYGALKITGQLKGAYTIKPTVDNEGGLLIDTTLNTSKMPDEDYSDYLFLKGASNILTTEEATVNIFVEDGAIVTVNGIRGDIVIEYGGTLKGSGTVNNVTATSGSDIMPGTSPGCLTTDNLVLTSGVTFTEEINGTTRCTEYDQTVVTGTVTLNDASLSVVLGGSYDPADGATFMIIDNDGTADAVTGTFSGLAEGANLTVGSQVFTISYTGGDGNDVVLTAIATPTAPDTGFGPVKTGIIGLIIITLLSAGFIYYTAQRTKKTA